MSSDSGDRLMVMALSLSIYGAGACGGNGNGADMDDDNAQYAKTINLYVPHTDIYNSDDSAPRPP